MSDDAAERARRSLRTMRETRYCDPPGHSWSKPTGLDVGNPCQCGAVVMDASMWEALNTRCEPDNDEEPRPAAR